MDAYSLRADKKFNPYSNIYALVSFRRMYVISPSQMQGVFINFPSMLKWITDIQVQAFYTQMLEISSLFIWEVRQTLSINHYPFS